MAIENTLLLKVGGGLIATGGTAGAGYYAHSQGLFKSSNVTVENESEKNYLIVKTTEHTTNQASGEIYDVGLFSSEKNFTCSATISGTAATPDNKCEIYKLSEEEKKLAKAITNNPSINANNIKKAGNYLKITSPALIDSISKWESTTEQLISVAHKTETGKLFGKLIPVYKVKNGEIVKRKTSYLFAKVKDGTGTSVTQPTPALDTTQNNYQCQLATDKFDCSIIELELTSSNKTITVPGSTTLTAANLKAKDKHFRIEMEEKHIKKINFTDQKQTIDVIPKENITTDKHHAKLTPLFHRIDQEISGPNSFWLLAKPDATETESKTGYTDCKIGDTTVKCDIYKFSTNQTSISSISFSGSLTKTTTSTDIKSETHLVIKFENNSPVVNNLQPEFKVTLSSSTAGSNKQHVLTVKKRLFVDSSTTGDTLTINSVHMLDE